MTVAADHLRSFLQGPSIEERWNAARELMAAKELAKQTGDPAFMQAYSQIGGWANDLEGLQRLLAIDLVVRIASFAKKLRPNAERLLKPALARELPPLSLAAETKDLPPEAKPAEIRENVAAAIAFARGPWVEDYVIRSLAEEDRSSKCRLELAQQLAAINPDVDIWFEKLFNEPSLTGGVALKGVDAATAQLRDLFNALAEVVARNRNQLHVSDRTGPLLARLTSMTLQLSPRSARPQKLELAAVEAAKLLDEILLTRLSLISVPESYAIAEAVHRWWQPLPYPEAVRDSFRPVVEKIVAAIVLMARSGSRSESLVARLRQAIGDKSEADRRLSRIADEEPSLPVDIHDWLRGKRRIAARGSEHARTSLEAIASESFIEALGRILLDLEIAWRACSEQGGSQQPELLRAVQRVRIEAAERGLEIGGEVGDVVDYSPSAHQTLDGEAPANPRIRIVRPMIVRKLAGGGTTAVVRALVTTAD